MAETTFSLTDENELLEFEMIPTGPRGLKGDKGDPGDPGSPGEPGQPGDDGFSPTVAVTDITGGHRVVITDAQGPHTFDVMDGQGGSVTVDDELSSTSTNPVQNKVVKAAIDQKAESSDLDDLYGDFNDLNDSVSLMSGQVYELNNAVNYVSGQVANKISEPGTEGTNGQVLMTDGNGGRTWGTPQGGGAVDSVNGKTGVVVLGASDVHALPDTTQIDEVAVQPTQPTSQTNKMWIDPEGEGEVQLALYSDIHSPLSKILDVTLEEESALIVTEINGTPLSAEELDMLVYAPTGTAIAAGTAYVYNGQTGLGDAYHVARTVSDAGVYWCARWMKQGGVWASEMGRSFSSGNLVQPYRYFVNELANERYGRSVIDYPKITQIKLPTLPADTRIILYAR